MANTIQLRQRIKTAQNLSKTTRAMQMIAASHLKKAQEATLSGRPYVEKLVAITRNVSSQVDKDFKHPYLSLPKKQGKTLVVAISPDKGLCGGLVTNVTRELIGFDKQTTEFITIGKKIERAAGYLKRDLIASFPFGNTLPKYDIVYPVVKLLDEQIAKGQVTQVQILTTHFVSIFTQVAVKIPLLPLDLVQLEQTETEKPKELHAVQLFEPSVEALLPSLLTRYIEMKLYQEILESYLSELAARMISMQNATNNANEMIEDLRLEYNKTRQAKITSEILDISGGSAAYDAAH